MTGAISYAEKTVGIGSTNVCNNAEGSIRVDEHEGYSFTKVCKRFSTEVSVGGIKYVTNSEANTPRRVVWALLVFFGAGFASYQIIEQTRYFIGNPTTVDIKVNRETILPFPTVTICNENMYRKSVLNEIDTSGNAVRAFRRMFPPYQRALQMDNNFWLAVKYFEAVPKSDWKTWYEEAYVTMEDSRLDCTFDGDDCTAEQWASVDTKLGRCIQFNPHGNLSIQQAGSNNGLSVILNADQNNYLVQSSPVAGFRVLMHNRSEPALVEDWGFHVNTNQHSAVQLSQKTIKNLPRPYGDCSDLKGYVYSQCAENCFRDFTLHECNCTYTHLSDRLCSPAEMVLCLGDATTSYYSENQLTENCECPSQCEQYLFPFTLTSSDFSEYFLEWLSDLLGSTHTETSIRRDMLTLNIYFAKLESERLETQPAYTLLSLLCDVGGALGLILGSTILTAFEFGDFLIVSIYDACVVTGRCKRKIKVGTTADEESVRR